jgi:myo-inositol-1(or 4)-monophosphatase
VFGVVVAPALGITWKGGRDIPSTRADVPCRVSDIADIEDALLATGFPYDRRTNPLNNFDAFIGVKQRCQAIRRCGSAAIDLCLVADGTYDGYWERKLMPWDLAGGAAIVSAAGGRVSSFDGGVADYGKGHIVATNGKVHDALIEELAKHASTRG